MISFISKVPYHANMNLNMTVVALRSTGIRQLWKKSLQ